MMIKAEIKKEKGVHRFEAMGELSNREYAELLIRLETWAARAYAEEQQGSGREQTNAEWLADYAAASHGQ